MQPRLAVLCLIPLELGGASTVANLWPEPWADPRGAHRKDDLENALSRQVCSGSMTLSPFRPMVPMTRVWAARRWSI